MNKYCITLRRTVYEIAQLEFDAKDQEHALELVDEEVLCGEVEWVQDDATPYEVDAVDQIGQS